MQDSLFADDAAPPEEPKKERKRAAPGITPAVADLAHGALAAALPAGLRLGTSSWNYPGWKGLVWEGEHEAALLSRRGLPAYAQHALMRSVCLDRAFYRALTASQYAGYAAQVPGDFRFVVKAPSMVTDALVRAENGQGREINPLFLDARLAVEEFVRPALEGLGERTGALVFQLSPMPMQLLADVPTLLHRLETLLMALPPLRPVAPDAVIAVEVRDPVLLQRPLADLLRRCGATFCLGLHAKMPPIDQQLPMLRALWPGPLVCRWNLNPVNGAFGYEEAERRYEPYDRIQDPDPRTRQALARVIRATTAAGQLAYVTVSNQAEGSAPLSIAALAQDVLDAA
ncbi:MAG: DUF72 domain-containing protein [Pseudomonadota bacterium]